MLAVEERKEACLLALEKFLDHDLAPASPKAPAKARLDRGLGLVVRLRDDDALAGGEPVGLDHDRQRLPAR